MATDPVIPFDYLEREKRRAQSQQGSDPIADAMGLLHQEQIRSTIIRAPDAASTANVTRVARDAGEPPAMVEDRVADVAKAQQADRFTRVLGQYPAFTGWAIQNPRDAVAASGDHKSLGLIGDAWKAIENWGTDPNVKPRASSNIVGGAGPMAGGVTDTSPFSSDYRGSSQDVTPYKLALRTGAGVSGLVQGTLGVAEAAGEASQAYNPVDWAQKALFGGSVGSIVADLARARRKAWGQTTTDLEQASQAKSVVGRGILSGVESVPGSLAALGVTLATGNPYAGASVLGATTGGQSYGDARDAGLGVGKSLTKAGIDAAIETGTEILPERYLGELAHGAPITKAIGRYLLSELGGEEAATLGQDFNQWAMIDANKGKSFADYAAEIAPHAVDTAIAVLTTGAVMGGAGSLSRILVKQTYEADQAAREKAVFDAHEKAAAGSEYRKLDPEGYAQMVGYVSEAQGRSSVFVPAEAVRAYQQSDAYDQFEDPFSPYQSQIDEAAATGGDVVLPASFALGTLPGTSAWAAVKDDLRLRPGGMSAREADEMNSHLDEMVKGLAEQHTANSQSTAQEFDARSAMVERVTHELQNAGFTPTNAAVQAELIAQRVATRAARLGRNMQPGDFDTRIMSVLPPALAQMQQADNVDLVINAMRTGKDATKQTGKSLLDFIAAKGGIEDRGGNVAAMGGDKWHVGKVGKRKLLKAYNDAQGNMLGSSGSNPNSISNLIDAAISEGYFPELLAMRENGEKIDDRVLLDAIGQELGGSPVYPEAAKVDNVRLAADELRQMLEDQGRDSSGMSDAEIRRAIADHVEAMRGDGTTYEQMPDTLVVDGVERSTRNSEGMPLSRSEEGVRAFWAWFGDSKVVDEEGRPLVVYHGTGADIEAFNGITWASVGTGLAQEYAAMREVRGQGMANVMPLYMRAERVFDADLGLSKSETVGSFFNEALEQAMAQEREVDLERARSLLETVKAAAKREESGPRYAREDFWFEPETMFGKDGATAIRDLFDLLGFDSIKMQENGTDTYGAFSPTQIKSINNRGTFDPVDARILFQSDEFQNYGNAPLSDVVEVDDLVSDEMVPSLTAQDLVGLKIFPTISDRTAAAAIYGGIDSAGAERKVALLGGPLFPLRETNWLANVVWANRGKGVTAQKADKLVKGATHMMVVMGDADMHISNTTVQNAFLSTIEAYIRTGRISPENLGELAELVRTPSPEVTDSKTGQIREKSKEVLAIEKRLAEFPGFNDVRAFEDYVHSLSFEARKRILQIMASKKAQAFGAPSMTRILDATREPSMAGHRWGDGVLLVELDKDRPFITLGEEGTMPHPDFPLGIRGKVVGRMKTPLNYETLWADWTAEAKIAGKQNVRRAFELAKPVVEVTRELADRIAASEASGIDSARQARLAVDFVLGNWKTTDAGVKQGGISPQEYLDAIANSPAKAVLSEYTLKQVKADVKSGAMTVYQLGADGQIFFALKRGDPSYAADYGIETPGITDNEVMLTSVINNEQGARGVGGPAVVLKALQEGATVLDCFAVKNDKFVDGFLPKLYAEFGFEKVAEVPFDPSYYDDTKLAEAVRYWKESTPGYDPETHGYPPLVIMKWAGTDEQRASIVQRYFERGLEDFLAGGTRADVSSAFEELAGNDRQASGRPSESNAGPARGMQGTAGRGLSDRLRRLVGAVGSLTPEGARNLGLTPEEVARVGRSEGRTLYQSAYHGSPHIFDRFSLDAIGTGEGAQAYGYGLYFAGRKEIAEHYRRALSGRGNIQIDGTDLLTFMEQSPAQMRESAKSVALDFYEYEGVTREQQEQANQSFGWAAFARALDQVRAQRAGFPDLTQTFNYISARFEKEANQKTDLRDKLSDLLVAAYARALGQSGRLTIEDPGRLYQVEIPDDNEYLLWDKPLSEQSGDAWDQVIDAVQRHMGDPMGEELAAMFEAGDQTGEEAYRWIAASFEKGFVPDGLSRGPSLSHGKGAQMASEILKDAGIAGIKYLDGGSRADGEGSFNYVVFDDSRVSITAYEQSYGEGPRGRISLPANGFGTGPATIELFQNRNPSTLLHELGHQWLEELRYDANLPGAPDQLKNDWQAVQDWFAANGHPVVDGFIPTEAHELWARGHERYLMEGKSPSSALTRLFETFRGWLLNVYRTVEALRSPISPEIRQVFDRLYATDEEITQRTQEQAMNPLFKDAASAGMTGPEFEAYTEQVLGARDKAHADLLAKTMASIKRRVTKAWNDERRGVLADEAERLDASPILSSLRMMKATPLSLEWLQDRMGQDVTDLLPKRVPPIWREGGANPDSLAEMAGFESGQQMIEVLIGAERQHRQAKEGGDQRTMRERMIQQAADAEMQRRHGDDPFNDGSIEQEAIAAVNNELAGEVLASEIRILSRKTGQRPTPYKIARDWARGKVRGGTVAEEASPGSIQRHARAVAKAGREAEKAMLAGKFDEAQRFKQQQMLSSALLAEAKAAHDEVTLAQARLAKIAKRKTMKSVDQDYLEQAHALLDDIDLGPRSQKSLERQGKWEAWAAAREAEGYDVLRPDAFRPGTHWSKLPVETFLGLDETIKQVLHLGRLKQTLLDNQEQREWDAVFDEAVGGASNISGPPPADLAEPGWWDALKGKVLGVDAALLKMETVFDWLDGGNSNGVFNRIAFRPVADAQAREQDMLKDYYGRIKALFEAVPGEVSARWNDVLNPPFIDVHTERPMRINRKQAVAMALNIGNEGNLQRLADGYRVSPAAVEQWLGETLTAEEWQFVQGVWDTIDTLWPQIEALEKRVNGIAPEKVEARTFSTPHGQMRGGYYPAIYDVSRDYKAAENAGKETDLFEGRYTRATTRASSTKERAEKVKRPILLDLGVINRHLGEVIHDITHREAVIQAHKFLSSERVRRAVDQALGSEIGKQLGPWVKFVANSWAQERAGNEGFGRWIGKARANATVVGMGFRATTMVTQIAGYSNSVEVVGAEPLAKAIAQFSSNPVAAVRSVMEKSGEIRHRMDTLDRDLRSEIAKVAAANPASKLARQAMDAKRFMFHGIGYMDMAVSVPTWMAGYSNAIALGMSEADAIYAGDKAVRQSQGAGSPKDLAAIQRGTGKWGEALKLVTMFYSYFSAQYQRERTLGRDIMAVDGRRSRSTPKLVARAFFLLVLPPLLTEVLRAAAGAGNPPDDDEWWTEWVLRKLTANAVGPIPVVRDLIEPVWQGVRGAKVWNPSVTPLQRAMDSIVAAGKDVGHIARGEETKHAVKDLMETAGYVTGLVPGQVASATQFLVDVGNGTSQPKDAWDWIEGLSTGKVKQ